MGRIIEPRYYQEPVNDGERKTFKFLLDNLPPLPVARGFDSFSVLNSEYVLIPNIQIPNQVSRNYLEIDCILITPHCVYVIEIKDWKGKISGDDYEWILNDSEHRNNPNILISDKAKIVNSFIVSENIFLSKKFWCQSLVIVPNESELYLTGRLKDTTFKLDNRLLNYLKSPELINRSFVKKNSILNIQREISSILSRKGKGKQSKSLEIAGYKIEETLYNKDNITEYLGKQFIGNNFISSKKRIRVFTLPVFEEKEILMKFESKILRNYRILEEISQSKNENIIDIKAIHRQDSDKIVEILEWSDEGTLRSIINKKNRILSKSS